MKRFNLIECAAYAALRAAGQRSDSSLLRLFDLSPVRMKAGYLVVPRYFVDDAELAHPEAFYPESNKAELRWAA